MSAADRTDALAAALAALGVDRLSFGIHASAFPASPLDTGYGSPHATGPALFGFLRGLGFDTLQLGPGGQVSNFDPSPYDATNFARSVRSLDVGALAEDRYHALVTSADVDRCVAEAGSRDDRRADPVRAARVVERVLDLAHERFRALPAEHPARRALAGFREEAAPWLELDAPFEALARRLGHDDPARFDPAVRSLFEPSPAGRARLGQIRTTLRDAVERVELAQWLARAQEAALRDTARAAGMTLFGDLPIGWSHRDRFLRGEAFSKRWVIGAPPSRTNPAGQPWGYPLLDPDQLDDPGSAARRALALEVNGVFQGHDGIRIDHPHGLVCPWIYPADASDPALAVREGTRAFGSPDATDAELGRWAIARLPDLNPASATRFADDWVQALDEAQVARYARLIDAVLEVSREHGGDARALAVEVLSTCPTPLRLVLRRHGLGRFRVTQKADPTDAGDPYRTDRAEPADWAMLGNHDTPPIFGVVDAWRRDGRAAAHVAYLAARLSPDERERTAFAARLAASTFELAQALLADLFLCPARNVMVHFVDLFGEEEPFNRAGVVHADNWTLRLPAEVARTHAERVAARRALDVPSAVALALRARGVLPDVARALLAAE